MKRLFFVLFILGFVVSIFQTPLLAKEAEGCARMCTDCSSMCKKNLESFLKKGGKYAEPERVNLMKDCIKICDTNADFLSRKSANSGTTDDACADICKKCAAKCEELNDPKLKECIAMCKDCASACAAHTK
jgi:hypothetical protein